MEHPAVHLHEPDDRLELYALDRLSEPDVIRIEEHLLVCENCRQQLERIAEFAFTVQDVLNRHPEFAKKQAREPWWSVKFLGPRFVLAACAGLFLCGAAFLISTRTGAPGSSAALASLQLTALRGELQTVSAARELDLRLTDAPASGAPFRLEIVDAAGSAQWRGTPRAAADGLHFRIVKAFPAGTYFTRLYDASGKLIHEYGFRVL
jgi:hypothetical protein